MAPHEEILQREEKIKKQLLSIAYIYTIIYSCIVLEWFPQVHKGVLLRSVEAGLHGQNSSPVMCQLHNIFSTWYCSEPGFCVGRFGNGLRQSMNLWDNQSPSNMPILDGSKTNKCGNNWMNNDRRKFRSQTSDNMDRWKAEQWRGREKRKIWREKSRRERVRRKKMQMREKVGKSRNTVFF